MTKIPDLFPYQLWVLLSVPGKSSIMRILKEVLPCYHHHIMLLLSAYYRYYQLVHPLFLTVAIPNTYDVTFKDGG